MKPLIGKRIGATKSFRCLSQVQFGMKISGVVLSSANVSVHCNQLDNWRWAKWSSYLGVSLTKCLFAPASSCIVFLRMHSAAEMGQVNYHQILTGTMKIANERYTKCGRLYLVSTQTTMGFKFGIFEFELACYQWGNSWCLYCII